MRVSFEYLRLTGTFIKLSCLIVMQLFSICISFYFSIIRIRKYVEKDYLEYLQQMSMGLIIVSKIWAPNTKD